MHTHKEVQGLAIQQKNCVSDKLDALKCMHVDQAMVQKMSQRTLITTENAKLAIFADSFYLKENIQKLFTFSERQFCIFKMFIWICE